MIKRASILGLVFLAVVIISGGYRYMSLTGGKDIPVLDDEGYSSEGIEETVEAVNEFGFDLYGRYCTDGDNIFYSPYSISTALSMTYEGATGETARQMQQVFHFLEHESERRSSTARIFNLLNDREKAYQLHTVNALWMQKDYPIREEYISAVESYYGGSAECLDFMEEPDKSRIIINDWVEDRTNNKIQDLFPSGTITPLTRLVLTNAIYFKGDWMIEFDAEKTRTEDFHLIDGNKIKVDMMQMHEASFNYTETEELQMLELPYKVEELSMVIMLPKDNNLDELEKNLNYENYLHLVKEMNEEKLNIYLPKYKLETKYFMKKDLMEMGMPLAFTGSADFSGMTEEGGLFISNVIHQAYIEVDEKGTEAAAATGVVMLESSIEPSIKVFKADHPFIFTLHDRETGIILFMGRVMNP